MPQESILDARLAEIDRRLRTIQSGLAPADDPARLADGEAPARAGAAASPPAGAAASPPAGAAASPPALRDELAEAGRLVARLHELTVAHDRLLASSRELLAAFSDALANAQMESSESPATIGVAVGPFADTAVLRRFGDSLSSLPGVRSVAVREYAGADRVIVDVHLSDPTS
jgi:hypothetical protein